MGGALLTCVGVFVVAAAAAVAVAAFGRVEWPERLE